MSENSKQVFFHVGLGKVASSYLQYRFFPKLHGIRYIQRTKYHEYDKIIHRADDEKFLVSREFDRQLEGEVRRFAEMFPQGRLIILLRRHDAWIASQYRRFVKNGMYMSFDEFIDLDEDRGFWKKGQMTFYPMLTMLEEVMGRPPLVMFHGDLKTDPWKFFDTLAAYMGASYDKDAISLNPIHKSYTDKQLRIIRKFRLYEAEPHGNMRNPIDWLRRRWRFLVVYSILYPAALVPESWAPDGELIPPDSLVRIHTHFKDDWERCIQYAGKVPEKV